jgi:hypothetical protein
MSKTYRDKLRYQAKDYYSRQPSEYEWIGPFRIFLGHNPKDINEPEWWSLHRFYTVQNYGNAKWWHRWANRKHRRTARKLIRAGHYDAIPRKPENVDWNID